MSERTSNFPCPGCGGDMTFDVEKQSLSCPYCGNVIEIAKEEYSVVKEYPIEMALEKASKDWGGATVAIRCESCGAETIIQVNQLTTECAFCGSIHIRQESQGNVIRPETIIPFKIDKRSAMSKFRTWLKKRWLAPGNLKALAREGKMTGVYIPFWTFDAETDSFYTAQKGTYYYVTETVFVKDSDGRRRPQQKRVRKTRWSFTSGVFRHFFDDVLVCASKTDSKNLIKRLEPFHLKELVEYKNEYLSGFMAEKYSIGLDQGFNEAKSIIRSELHRMIRNHIIADEVRNLRIQTSFSNVTFKHILLPIWISAYRYRDKVYKFLVNGQTGEVKGEAPVSALKVLLLILAGLIVAGVIYLISQS
ncbi:MAG: TFIIB-type zinc ribbon-containing protein [Clostridiaceae bacterium]|jgi:ribosomal protein S27E|nr:TFIIB-type zinc ribbon-containing protein [Clostridiaceae bacterium]